MIGVSWHVPVEIIRAAADAEGTLALIQLVGLCAALAPHARVELLDGRFIAHVSYELPGYGRVTGIKIVSLAAYPQENGSVAA